MNTLLNEVRSIKVVFNRRPVSGHALRRAVESEWKEALALVGCLLGESLPAAEALVGPNPVRLPTRFRANSPNQ